MRIIPCFYFALLFAVVHTAGCQSWQGGGFPVQNATRVPPPGTGTYSLPSGYYNNATSALTPETQTMQASGATPTGLRSASALGSGPLPTTNLTGGTALSHANGNGAFQPGNGVVSASYTSVSSGALTAATAFSESSVSKASNDNFDDSIQDASGATTASLSDVETETPSLQWQQFGGQ